MSTDKPGVTKSSLLSGLGTSFELIQRLVRSVKEAGGGEKDLRKILNEEEYSILTSSMGRLLVNDRQLVVADVDDLVFRVNHKRLNIPELIEEGKFTCCKIKIDLTTVDDVSSEQVAFVRLVRLKLGNANTSMIKSTLAVNGFQLVSLRHFITFASVHRSIVQQTNLRYPHQDWNLVVYASRTVHDLTIRWEPNHGFYADDVTHTFLVYA